jgi:ubiquitin carboxyl-terminal hydrolase 25/28
MGPTTRQPESELNELGDSQAENITNKSAFGPISPPKRPPPVPPHPVSQLERQQQIREEVELGAQQDVTEVINNVLFQTQCAIKPYEIDADGEQVDLVKEYVPSCVPQENSS